MKIKLLRTLALSSVLLLTACGQEDEKKENNKPKEEHKKTDEQTNNKTRELEENKQTKKESENTREETSQENSFENDNKESEHHSSLPEDNTVYGKLTKEHNESSPIVIGDMTYILGDNDKILQAERSFNDRMLSPIYDRVILDNYSKNLMADDAEYIESRGDHEQKYHSPSLNKDYYVTFSLDEEGNVMNLIVSSFD